MQSQNSHTNQQNEKIYLVVVFGPPASGKSLLSQTIKNSYDKQTGMSHSSVVVSTDNFEEYLKYNSFQHLINHSKSKQLLESIKTYRLKRSQFSDQNWKNSRLFVKQTLPYWVQHYKLIIIDDDLLLKSQRKQFRHIAQTLRLCYLEITIEVTLQNCLENLEKRKTSEQPQYNLSPQACRDAFSKFECQKHDYLLTLNTVQTISWSYLEKNAKIVQIEHPELQTKEIPSPYNAEKNQVQIKIRRFISQIMISKELQKQYFKDADIKSIASFVGVIKKRFCSKNKSFQNFLQFFETETKTFHE